jgi:beta-carotene 3-hydroxylase
MLLCAYGFLTPGMIGGMCFGSGLGITLFGIAYMFVHDGLVHRWVGWCGRGAGSSGGG